MEAVVVAATTRRRGGGPDDGQATLIDAITEHFESETWDLVLEVTAPSGERFQHQGKHRIANRLGGLRKSFTAWEPVPGLALPVWVSEDRRDVTVDWDAFVDRGGIDRAAKLLRDHRAQRAPVQGAAATGEMLAKRPKLAAKQRDLAIKHGPGMAAEVTTGVRPANEFAQWISGLVQGGALEPHEGADLLRQAGIDPS
jgi:hypothetical protein